MKILPVHQNSCRFRDEIVGYEEFYGGLAVGASPTAEGERVGKALGSKEVMMLANHGVMIASTSLAICFDTAYYLEQACMIQYKACRAGPVRLIRDDIAKVTFQQFEDCKQKYADAHLAGFLHKYKLQ